MATQNQSEQIMSEIKDIINESFSNQTGTYTPSSFNLKRVINEALEASNYNTEVIKFVDSFNEALVNGVSEPLLIEKLCEGVTVYSKSIPSMAEIATNLQNTINANREEIEMTKMYESIASPSLKSMISESYNNYMSSHSLESKGNLIMILESVGGIDQAATAMLQYLNGPSVAYTPEVINLYDNVNESMNNNIQNVDINEQKEVLLNKMKEYVDGKLEESKTPTKKSYLDIDNNIKLYETIDYLRNHVKNDKLNDVLNLYESALNDGCREEMIYETFMHRLNEEFSYWGEVCDQMNAMEKRITNHKANISFTKILETLSNDGTWSYLVPIIEDVVVAYEEEPNIINRNILMNHLRMYDSCQYVRDIMQVANMDNSKEGLLMKESSQFISQRAHVEDVFSPVQYIKENECIFNVENQFYVKKGKNIARLNKEVVNQLSESFLALAKIINDPNVEINEAENTITYYSEFGAPIVITEGKVTVNDNVETPDTLKNLNEMHTKYQDYTDIDFLTGAFLCENFNNIAKVDFVKKVSMNEGSKTLDVFKVAKNIYVASHDSLNEEHTFYRNVKPLQVKNIINEHFGIDVGNLFEDLLPNQDQLARELVLIKEEYETKIEKLNELKEKYEESIQEAELYDPSKKSLFEAALVEIKKEIDTVKKEFMKFQGKVNSINESDKIDNERVEGILNDAEEALGDTTPDDFSDSIMANADNGEDLDGSEDIDGSDIDFTDNDGTEYNEDIDDGSDFDFTDFELDGSDEDEFTSSDGDDMTDPITGNDFTTDNSDLLSQDDDYNLDDKDQDDDTFVDEELDAQDDDANVETPENVPSDDDEIDFELDDEIDDEDDPFGKETAALQDDEIDDIPAEGEGDNIAGNEETEQVDDDADLDYANFKIVKVDFDINMRTGEKKGTGKVIVIVPMVDAEGNKTSDTKNIDFYISEINGEKSVVLDSEGLTLEMYNAVCDAVKGSNTFNEVDPTEGQNTEIDVTDDEIESADEPTDVQPEETTIEDTAEDHSEVFDSGSDETTVLSIDDGIEPHGIDITDVTDDEPAHVEDTPEGASEDDAYKGLFDEDDTEKVDSIPESKKAKKGNKLNESEEELDINDEGDTEGIELDISANQEDPIAVIKDVLETYASEGGDCEVGDINDYDVDGTDVNSINVRIGDNDYTFFTVNEDIYCALTADFDANSQDIDTLQDWTALKEDESDEAPMCANVEIAEGDTQSWVDFVTDVIAVETGDDVQYEVHEPEENEEEVEVSVDDDTPEEIEESVKVSLKKK